MSKILPLQEYVLKSGQKDTHTHKNTDTTRGKWKLVSPQTLYVLRFVRSWDVFSDWETPLVQVFLCEKKTLTNASQNCLLWNPNLKWNPKSMFFFLSKGQSGVIFVSSVCVVKTFSFTYTLLFVASDRESVFYVFCSHTERRRNDDPFLLFIGEKFRVFCLLCCIYIVYRRRIGNWEITQRRKSLKLAAYY